MDAYRCWRMQGAVADPAHGCLPDRSGAPAGAHLRGGLSTGSVQAGLGGSCQARGAVPQAELGRVPPCPSNGDALPLRCLLGLLSLLLVRVLHAPMLVVQTKGAPGFSPGSAARC